MEPVYKVKDRYGFVCAPTRETRCYNPFKTASAYHQ